MDFGDLSEDLIIQEKLTNFQSSVEKIGKILDQTLTEEAYEKLPLKDKIDYDLFMAYTLNTLFWLYLKTKGQDPTQNDVKNQLNRIKQYMIKAKEAYERHTLRPRLDQEAAKRFIKHGIQHKEGVVRDDDGQPRPKKIKFQ